MEIYVLNRGEQVVRTLQDDTDESFLHACESAPRGTTRRGVSRYGLTLLNPIQSEMLAEELRALPSAESTEIIRDIGNAAEEVVRTYGLLRFIGE